MSVFRRTAGAIALGLSIGCAGGSSVGSAVDASDDTPSTTVHVYLDASAQSPDATAGDDSGDAEVTRTCAPQEAGAPPPFVPPHAPRSVCTDTQVRSYYSACWQGPGTTADCDAFRGDPANSPCILCMTSASTDASWSTITVFPNDSSQANVGGCIALVDQDAGPGSCAAARQASDLCRRDACSAMCPGGSTTDGLQAFDQCEMAAATTVCAGYEAAANCELEPRYSPCLFADFQSYFIGLGRIFCEVGLDGGGADAASDAPSDAAGE